MNLLLSQFHDSPIVNAVQNAFLDQIAELERAFEQLRNLIQEAEGAQLELLGKIVGQKRLSMADAQYKLWLQARILLNRSRGLESDVRELVDILIDQEFEIQEHADVAFTVFIHQPISQDPKALFEIIGHAKPLGVQARLQFPIQEPIFRLDTVQVNPSFLMECLA